MFVDVEIIYWDEIEDDDVIEDIRLNTALIQAMWIDVIHPQWARVQMTSGDEYLVTMSLDELSEHIRQEEVRRYFS